MIARLKPASNRYSYNNELTPAGLRMLLLDVGKEYEEENLKLVKQSDVEGIDKNVAEGMEHIPFTPEVAAGVMQAVLNNVVRGWVSRVGGPESEGAKLYNEKVAPIVGVRVTSDGRAEEI